jgi:hypothetical protein
MRTGALILAAAAALIAGAWGLEMVHAPGVAVPAAAMTARLVGLILMVPGTIKLAFGYWRARDAAHPERMPAPGAGALVLTCPSCRRPTSSLKQVELTDLTFLVLVWSMRRTRYTGCPACTRATVEDHLLRNLLSANVLWLAPALQGTTALIRSFVHGHSRAIHEAVAGQSRSAAR